MPEFPQDPLEPILESIADKNGNALSKLYHKTVDYVYGLALRITRSHEMAEEVVGDVYFQVWNQGHRYNKQRGGVITWLSILCRSRALDTLRRLKSHSIEFNQAFEERTHGDEYSHDILAASERNSQLHAALKNLDTDQRQLLSLAYFRDYSHSELATITGIPVGTVKSRLRNTLVTLKSLMADNYRAGGIL